MYKFVLAARYLLKRRMSYFAVAATALCVFVVLVVITVLSGLNKEFKENTHQFAGDCVISSSSLVGFPYYDEFVSRLEKTDFVKASSVVIRNYASVSYGYSDSESRYHRTMKILGIEPVAHNEVTGFDGWLCYNKGFPERAFEPVYEPNLPGCVPGINIMLQRDSQGGYHQPEQPARVEFEIACFPLTAKGAPARAGVDQISTRTFYYSDHADTGLAKPDGNLIFLPFDDAQLLCGMGTAVKRASAIHIKFRQNVNIQAGSGKIKQLWLDFVEEKKGTVNAGLLDSVQVKDWKNHERVFIAAVEIEQTMMIIVFAMLGVITVFIVFVVFYMIVSHKSKDIGILKAIGVSNGGVSFVFLIFSFFVGAIGSFLGTAAGWGFLVHINRIEDRLYEHFGFQLWDRTMYAIGDIPNSIDFDVLLSIIISAVGACMIGAIIPSRQAARMEPVKTLQVNRL